MVWDRGRVRRWLWTLSVVAFGCADDGDIVGGTETSGSSEGSTAAPMTTASMTTAAMTTASVDDGTSSTGPLDDASSSSESGSGGSSESTGTDATTGSTSTGETDPDASTSSTSIADTGETDPTTSSGSTAGTDPTTAGSTSDDPTMTTGTGPQCTGDPAAFPVPCDPFAQDCPEGEKCMPYADDGTDVWNALGCFPVECDAVPVGDVCTTTGAATGIDNCEIGAMCWDVDPDTLEGTCVPMCSGSINNPVCESPQDYCAIANDGVLTLCLPTCDPLIQDCDSPGDTCVPVNELFACVPDGSGDQGAFNDPCDQINACDPGNACLPAALLPDCADPVACCSTFCNLGAIDPDGFCQALDPALACLPWYVEGQAPPGLENVGICGLP